jgi:serine protease Do
MTVWRKGASRDLQIAVGEMQQEGPRKGAERPKSTAPVANAIGLAVSDLPAERLKELRISGGVQVETAEGAAARAGVRPGDLILTLNNVEIKNSRQFGDVVGKLDLKRNIPLLVRRVAKDNDQTQYLIIRPAER